jgi:hypothetical protein
LSSITKKGEFVSAFTPVVYLSEYAGVSLMKEFEWSHLVMIAPSIPLIGKHFFSSGSIRFYILVEL